LSANHAKLSHGARDLNGTPGPIVVHLMCLLFCCPSTPGMFVSLEHRLELQYLHDQGATIFLPYQPSSSHREMKTSRHSRAYSIESQATLSTSNTTTTNDSTLYGLGTLSGKVIEAFGEATLRGVENIVIRRKLSTYRSLFPHADETTIKDIDSVYENILELSRYFMHSSHTADNYTT
jgi:hypothetical protein